MSLPDVSNVQSIGINSKGHILVAIPGQGVHISEDNGHSWILANNGLPNLYASKLVINSKDHIFVVINGAGLFRSIDDGRNWTEINNLDLSSLNLINSGDNLSSRILLNNKVPYPEGGHLETDFNTKFLSEWWYLNGRVDLGCSDGERREIGFLFTISHEESSNFNFFDEQLSWIIHFHAIYFQDGSNKLEMRPICVPRRMIKKFIALHTSYVFVCHPDETSMLVGSSKLGYSFNLITQDYQINWLFRPQVENTLDHSSKPIDFYSFERSFGLISGQVIFNGKIFYVVNGKGYFDHMIAFEDDVSAPWTTCFHGWFWAEVTTQKYQIIIYAMRSLLDGYDTYSYKKITLLNIISGRIIVEYEGNDVTIMQNHWIREPKYYRKRPQVITFSAGELRVTIDAENVAIFDHSDTKGLSGFVDFMSYKRVGAIIEYEGKKEKGTAFSEYLVTDMGVKSENLT